MRVVRHFTAVVFGAAALLGASSVVHAEKSSGAPAVQEELSNDACLSCHGDASMPRFVDAEQFSKSVHGQLACTSCHSDVTGIPHASALKSVDWQHIPETCGSCHADIQEQFSRSIHGKSVASGRRGAPVCTDCHGVHNIAPVKTASSTVFPSHIPETCGSCHAAQRIITKFRLPPHVVDSYMDSYHGLANQLGSVSAANCASCHSAHEILPSSDPKSSIAPQNLPKTCGACHAGVNANVARGRIHAGISPSRPEHPAVVWVRHFYIFLIISVLGMMVMHNALDFLKKLRAHLQVVRAERMDRNARLQHAALMIAFVALAFTGFALKFPRAWWANPFMGHMDWRSFGHRAAALIFCVLGAYHLWFMGFTDRGRKHLKALLPTADDLVQPFQMFAFYFGWRKKQPVFARYSYIEKAEYWALVWGSLIMTATGTLMLQESWTLAVFPKWFFDVVTTVHYYEAILACSAIVIWHFYFVIFDPEEYPMKGSWLTGRSSRSDEKRRREDD